MNRKPVLLVAGAALLASLLLTIPANASLPLGAQAPDFSTQGALDGKPFAFHLADALKKGPVVLYFFPKAFTPGCTQEAHAFADAAEDFKKAGATLIGLSADDLPKLEQFSTQECRSKFPVATATPAIIKAYDVPLTMMGIHTGLTARTSYVIARDGHITMVYDDLSWKEHVARTLAAARALASKQ